MRFVVVLFVVCVVGAGCQRHKSQCEPAVSGAIDRMVAGARGTMAPPIAANIARIVPKMKAAITASCEHDQWAPKVIECVAKADGREQLDACDALLTPQQRDNEHKRNDELLKAAVQPLQKNDPDKVRHDPHEGLGIPPADQLRGNSPPAQGSGSAAH
ncbi:MAG: hypothetical protein ABI467_17100 [Kofleriaceae bacterium]